ncbi:MAG: hypothetical protein ACUVWO_11615 [Thermodesulfobacteriota bacterium]
MMSWRYAIFSLLLFVAAVLLAQKNYDVWTQPLESLTEERRVRKAEPRPEGAFVPGRQQETTSLASTIAISEKNIFNPERREFSFTLPEQSKPMARPQIILYGVTIAKDFQAASLVQPGRPLRKGEREMMTLKIGEKVGDYKLARVLPDRITLESGEDSFEVLLYDANAPKKRAVIRTEVKPSEVKSTSPAPAPAAAPSPPAPAPVPRATEAPKPGEPSKERVIEAPLPRPVTPLSPSFPGTIRGRTPVRPYPPPESGSP